MTFKEYLKEREFYVDDDGVGYDDEGNTFRSSKDRGTYGLKDFGYKSNNYRSNTSSSKIDSLEGLIKYGATLGVSKEDVERYWNDMKQNIPAITKRIQYKAKKK